MKKKFEAVSGDQSLFDVVGASDDDLFIIKNRKMNGIYASESNSLGSIVIAERRPVPKYIPKAGDVFAIIDGICDHGELLCLKSNDHGVAFEYLEGEEGYFDSVSNSAELLFIRSQPIDKYVPKVGDKFVPVNKSEGAEFDIVFTATAIRNEILNKSFVGGEYVDPRGVISRGEFDKESFDFIKVK